MLFPQSEVVTMLPLFLAQPRDVLHRTYNTRCEKKASNPSDNVSWNGIEGHLWGCCNVIGGGRSPPPRPESTYGDG